MPACWIAISRLSWQFVVDGIKHFLTRPDTPYHSAVEWCTEGYTTLTPLGKWLRLPLHTTLTSTAHYIPQTLRSSHTFIEFSLKLSDISSTLRTLLYINSPNLTTSVKKEEVSRGVSLRYRSYHSHHLTISPHILSLDDRPNYAHAFLNQLHLFDSKIRQFFKVMTKLWKVLLSLAVFPKPALAALSRYFTYIIGISGLSDPVRP